MPGYLGIMATRHVQFYCIFAVTKDKFDVKGQEIANIFLITKGQIKPKADWRAIDSPKKTINEFVFFAMTVRKYLKLEISISSFKYFRTVKQIKQIRSFVFWENLWHAHLLSVLFNL